jgi:hypothetical protein
MNIFHEEGQGVLADPRAKEELRKYEYILFEQDLKQELLSGKTGVSFNRISIEVDISTIEKGVHSVVDFIGL